MISQIMDLSSAFVTGGASTASIDISGWEKISVQIVNPSGTFSFKATNDSGAEEGVTDGDASTAENFTALEMTNLADGEPATTTAAAGTFKSEIVFKFFQLSGTTVTADKVLVFLTKPY